MNFSRSRFLKTLLLAALAIAGASVATAQWRTETFDLKAGWQAINLRVDTKLETIEELFTDYSQIEEIWRWRPEALDARIVNAPNNPVVGVEWQVWKRDDRSNTDLFVLYPNSSYLVKVEQGAAAFTMSLKGRVGSPTIQWRTDGLNLLGFPTNPNSPPTVEAYFGPAEILDQQTEIYGYTGGNLSTEVNPARLSTRSGTVKRGRAYWIRSNKYADYDGPLRVRAAIGEGVDFGASRPTVRVILTNRTDRDLEATLSPQASEASPEVGSTVPQLVPLTRRATNGSGDIVYEDFSDPYTVTLRAGETLGMTIGIDRSQLSGVAGDEAFSLLKVTDSEGLSEFYVPAHAEVASFAGLWIGEAEITHVQNQLQRFQKDADENYLVDADGHYIPEYKKNSLGDVVTDINGDPVPDGDTELNATAQVYSLKVIMHVDASGNARLLSRAYVGIVGEDVNGLPVIGVSTGQSSLLAEYLDSASRVSAVHLPKKTNLSLGGGFAPGAQLAGTLSIAHDASGNPFLHSYHPDHDNLDARFESSLPEGIESYRVDRNIVLTLHADAGVITDPSWGTTLLTGVYAESIEGLHKDSIAIQGIFAIRRVVSESPFFESN